MTDQAAPLTDKQIARALEPSSYSGRPFTPEEIACVPRAMKLALIRLAKSRFPRNHRMTANAMCGAIAIIIERKVRS